MLEFEDYVKTVDPTLQVICVKLHELLMKIEPSFEHKKAWSGYGYKIGKNYSVTMVGYKDHVQLMVMRGIMIDAPDGVFQGRGVNTRHIKYYNSSDIDDKVLKDILRQQFELYNSGVRWE